MLRPRRPAALRPRLRALAAGARTRRWVAARAATGVGVALAAGALAGDLQAGAIASLGAFVGLYGADVPYRRRAWLFAGLVLALGGAMALGMLVGSVPALAVVVGGAVGFTATFAALTLRTGPPREFFVVMVFLIGVGLPAGMPVLRNTALVWAGGAFAWLMILAPALAGRRGPEQTAADAALLAAGDLLATVGRDGHLPARHDAIRAVRRGLVAAADARGPGAADARLRAGGAELILEATIALEAEGSPPVDDRWVAAVRGQAAADPAARPASAPDAPLPELPAAERLRTAHGRLVAGDPHLGDELAPDPRPSLGWMLRRSPHRRIATRIAVAVAGGLAIGYLLSLTHAVWVAIGALAALQGTTATIAVRRAWNRVAGTIAGALLAAALLAAVTGTAAKIIVLAALQGLVELLVVSSYGLAVVFITPLVLLLGSLTQAAGANALVGPRVADTAIGCAFALAIVLATRHRAPRGRLAHAQAAAVDAAGRLVTAAACGASEAALRPARRRAQRAVVELRAAEDDVVGDALWADPSADARWPITARVERLAHLAIGLPSRPPRAESADVDRPGMERLLAALEAAIRGRGSGDAALAAPVPELPGYPRSRAALEDLRVLVVDALVYAP